MAPPATVTDASVAPHGSLLPTVQVHENDVAAAAIVCAPSALSKMMGSLHPAGALYEKPVNIDQALEAHAAFVSVLRENNVRVYDVRDMLTDRVASSVGDRVALEELAFSCLQYVFDARDAPDAPVASADSIASDAPVDSTGGGLTRFPTMTDAERYYVSDIYKRLVIRQMAAQQLVDVIFTNPTVTVHPSSRDTGFMASYRFAPLTNIVFVRDQLITTAKGIVMGRLRSMQRVREVDILYFCLNKAGFHIIDRVPAPAFLEGGDFFPVGHSLCMLGLGPRSDWAAAHYLLENDLLGTESVAIVKDQLDRHQDRMHLDTVFNIVSSNVCVMLADIMGDASPTRRVVDEYVRVHPDHPTSPTPTDPDHLVGTYMLQRRDVEFSGYVRGKGFSIVEIPGHLQLDYGCNVLNLGSGRVLMTQMESARAVATEPCFNGSVRCLDFRGVSCMYGGLHCASQVVHRVSSRRPPSAHDGCGDKDDAHDGSVAEEDSA